MVFFGLLLIAIAILIGAFIISFALTEKEITGTEVKPPAPKAKGPDKQMAQIIKKESPVDDFLNKQ